KVERGVAKIPTAFTATVGIGRPVIAILGEYDALPELSQDAVAYRKPRVEGANGHACGHHLFGVASLEACVALGEQIKGGQVRGPLRYYSLSCERGGGDGSGRARIAVKCGCHGAAAHAAASPDKGRSALDAVQLTCHAAELLR